MLPFTINWFLTTNNIRYRELSSHEMGHVAVDVVSNGFSEGSLDKEATINQTIVESIKDPRLRKITYLDFIKFLKAREAYQ